LLFQQYDFPIYALDTIDERNTMSYNAVMIATSINQNRGYNNYPLKALQFHSFMWAAQDSDACLRKGIFQRIFQEAMKWFPIHRQSI